MDIEELLEEHTVSSGEFSYGGRDGVLYRLDRLLSPDARRELSDMDGVQTFVVRCEYAPEIVRTGVFVAD